jgi:hypothetical protein
VDQEVQITLHLDVEQLAVTAGSDDRPALDGMQRRVEGTQRVDSRCQHGFDTRAGGGGADQASGDFDLG